MGRKYYTDAERAALKAKLDALPKCDQSPDARMDRLWSKGRIVTALHGYGNVSKNERFDPRTVVDELLSIFKDRSAQAPARLKAYEFLAELRNYVKDLRKGRLYARGGRSEAEKAELKVSGSTLAEAAEVDADGDDAFPRLTGTEGE